MATGTAGITVTFGAGAAAGDFGVLIVESANEAITGPSGWDQITNAAGFGTAGTAGASRMAVFVKQSITAGDVSGGVAIADTGDHTNGVLLTYSGVDPTRNASQGLPNNLSNSGVTLTSVATTSATTASFGSGVAKNKGVILAIIATDRDSATVSTNTAASWSGVIGSNSFPVNGSSASGAGGGIIVNEIDLTADASGTTSFSCSITSSAFSSMLLYIAAPPPYFFNRQASLAYMML